MAQAGRFISPGVDLGDFRGFHRPGLFGAVQGRSAQAGYGALGENPLFAQQQHHRSQLRARPRLETSPGASLSILLCCHALTLHAPRETKIPLL